MRGVSLLIGLQAGNHFADQLLRRLVAIAANGARVLVLHYCVFICLRTWLPAVRMCYHFAIAPHREEPGGMKASAVGMRKK
jgi:hypothetical protein